MAAEMALTGGLSTVMTATLSTTSTRTGLLTNLIPLKDGGPGKIPGPKRFASLNDPVPELSGGRAAYVALSTAAQAAESMSGSDFSSFLAAP